jgi:hypothetical protein
MSSHKKTRPGKKDELSPRGGGTLVNLPQRQLTAAESLRVSLQLRKQMEHSRTVVKRNPDGTKTYSYHKPDKAA